MTTHCSHLLSSDEVDHLRDLLEFDGVCDVHSLLLQEFDTELDFTSKVRCVWVDLVMEGMWLWGMLLPYTYILVREKCSQNP